MNLILKKCPQIGGHLFKNFQLGKEYHVVDKYRTYLIVHDDKNEMIHVSRTACREFSRKMP